MIFEINVSQICDVQDVNLLRDTVVAVFKVDADTILQALSKVQESAEYKDIPNAKISGMCVVGGMPVHEIK